MKGKNIALSALVFASVGANAQTPFVEWNFNGPSSTTASSTPNIGTGTVTAVGGVTTSFASGIASGGSSDPVTTFPPNYGFQTTAYAPQSTQNGERGVSFSAPTAQGLGFTNIRVEFDLRRSNTASRWSRFEYTVDGTTFVTTGLPSNGEFSHTTSGDTWNNNITFDLSAIPAVNNNPNFGFRVVAIFDPAGTGYVATAATSTYATTGTKRFDMVQIFGTPFAPPTQTITLPINLQGTEASWAVTRELRYKVTQGMTDLVGSTNFTADANSETITFTLPNTLTGAAVIEIDGAQFLKRKVAINLSGANQTLGLATILNGDADNSTEVDLTDIDLIIGAYLTPGGNTEGNITDLDNNGEVDLTDIDIAIGNYLLGDDI